MTPALIVGTWLLSAQSPPSATQLAGLERRIAELEARISKAGDVTQIKAPFIVLGQDGRPILEVVNSPNNKGTGAVLVARHPGTGGGVYVMDEAGNAQAGMGVASEGHGAVYAFNKAGKVAAQMSGTPGFALWNKEGDNVAVLNASPEGRGRLSLWNRDIRVALLEESNGGGTLSLMKTTDGKPLATLGSHASGAGGLRVINGQGSIGAAVLVGTGETGLVAVTNSTGKTVAEMSVTSTGRGLFQAFIPGGPAIAVMGQGGPGDGGIFQISNAGGVKATLATAQGGGGMLQLISTEGKTTVEAGTMPSGRGIVRVGPFWKCSPIQPSTPVMSIGHGDCLVGSLEGK